MFMAGFCFRSSSLLRVFVDYYFYVIGGWVVCLMKLTCAFSVIIMLEFFLMWAFHCPFYGSFCIFLSQPALVI